MNDDVTLLVNGQHFGGWTAGEMTHGIERLARSFSFGITWPWPDAPSSPQPIQNEDEVEVLIGDELRLTGKVDATPLSYGPSGVTRTIVGRSKTRQLIDCSAVHQTGQWKDRKAEQIIAALSAEYGVDVVTLASTGARVEDHQIEPGETVHDSIERLLERRSLLATDDEHGRVVLTRVGAGRSADALVLGKNILFASAPRDTSKRYSEITVKGQRPGNDFDFGADVASVGYTATDPTVRGGRKLVIHAGGPADLASCRDLARWEVLNRAGRSKLTTYTVRGWRQSDGRFWKANDRVFVEDPIMRLNDEMVIAEVTFSIGEGGTTTRLVVAPKDAYELPPTTAPLKVAGWSELIG